MSNPLSTSLLLLAPLAALVRLGDRTVRDAGRWFDEADEVWEPFLVDDEDEPARSFLDTGAHAA